MAPRSWWLRNPRGAKGLWVAGLVLLLTACGEMEPEKEPDLDLWRARNAEAEGRQDWARIHYQRDFERHPDRISSLRAAAMSWLSGYQQSLGEGAGMLRQYLEIVGSDPEAEERLVSTLLLLGEWEEARTRAARLTDSPSGLLLQARAWLEVEPARAEAAVEQLLSIDAEFPRAHALAARLAQDSGDLQRAVEHARRAVIGDPLDLETFYLLGRLERLLGNGPAAREALEIHQQIRRLLADGTMAPLGPELELEILEDLQQRVPAVSFRFRKLRVEKLMAMHRLAEAGDEVRALAADSEAGLTVVLELAKLAGEAGRRSLARELFEQVLEMDSTNPGALASLAILDLEAGALDSARRRLREGLQAHPNFARLHYLLGRVELAEDHREEALGRWRTAVWLAPWQWAWRVALGEMLLSTGDLDEVRRLLAEAPEKTAGLEAFRQRHAAALEGAERSH